MPLFTQTQTSGSCFPAGADETDLYHDLGQTTSPAPSFLSVSHECQLELFLVRTISMFLQCHRGTSILVGHQNNTAEICNNVCKQFVVLPSRRLLLENSLAVEFFFYLFFFFHEKKLTIGKNGGSFQATFHRYQM